MHAGHVFGDAQYVATLLLTAIYSCYLLSLLLWCKVSIDRWRFDQEHGVFVKLKCSASTSAYAHNHCGQILRRVYLELCMPIEQVETPTQSIFRHYLFLMKLLSRHVMVQSTLKTVRCSSCCCGVAACTPCSISDPRSPSISSSRNPTSGVISSLPCSPKLCSKVRH